MVLGSDLGDCWQLKNVRRDIILCNTSSRPIRIDKFVSHCNCTTSDAVPLTIAPQSECKLGLQLDLSGKDILRVPIHLTGAYTDSGEAINSEGEVFGRIRPLPFTVSGSELNCFQLIQSHSAAHYLDVTGQSATSVDNASITPDSIGTVALERLSANDTSLTIIPSDSLSVGYHNATLYLNVSSSVASEPIILSIPLLFHVTTNVTFDCGPIHFGVLKVGSSTSRRIPIVSQLGSTFRIVDVGSSEEDAQISIVPETHAIDVVYSPTLRDNREMSIWAEIEDDCPNEETGAIEQSRYRIALPLMAIVTESAQ